MRQRLRSHLTYANLMATLAVFLVLSGGTAVALNGTDTVQSDDLGPGAQVMAPDVAANAVNGSDVVDNSLTGADVNESTLGGLWKLGGNAGTTAANFLGTTDNRPLNLRVNNARGLRLEPASDGTNQSPNVIGGTAGNSVTAGVHSATIGGGGRGVPSNPATANRVTDHQGTVGGGANNQAGDGAGGVANATLATVGGGGNNVASGSLATVGGGFFNGASGFRSTVAGGDGNTASDIWATVGGGRQNIANGEEATVAGGYQNTAGAPNHPAGTTVVGGSNNTASAPDSTVVGGAGNVAAGWGSLAAGDFAQANHDGAFVWADRNTQFDFASTAANQFSVRSTGGVRFVSAIDGSGDPTAGVTLAPGGGSWASLSDEASKTGVTPVSGRVVLRKLASVPVSKWSYRAQGPSIRHIGPMAQDLSRAFGVGEDRRHITSVDADGISLAAIKGLNEKVRALQRQVGFPAHAGSSGDGSSLPLWALVGLATLGLAGAAALGASVALRWQGGLRGSPVTG
jgi:hypothetical protein